MATNPIKKDVYQSTPSKTDYSRYQSRPTAPISTPYTSTPDTIGQDKTEQVKRKSGGGGGSSGSARTLTDTSLQSIPGQSTGGILESAKGDIPVSAPISKGRTFEAQTTKQPNTSTTVTSPQFNEIPIKQQSILTTTTYTGEAPERYKQGFGSGVRQFVSNINPFSSQSTYGLIGEQGFGTYLKETFISPFEYVGGTKAEKKVGININPQWRGTTFGEVSTPSMYQDTTDKTYFELTDIKKRELFTSAGVDYAGEPVTILPARVAENIDRVGTIREKYQSQVSPTTSEKDLAKLNEAYNLELQQTYNKQLKGLQPQINLLNEQSKDIFTPTSEKIIKTTGKGIEIGAITGATVFGGSIPTVLATAYLGARQYESTVDYVGSFNKLSTGQKIIGGTGLALGAVATVYTGNIASNKFYREWLNIRYSDIAAAPVKVTGAEIAKTTEYSRFLTQGVSATSQGVGATSQITTVYGTGVNRVGFTSRGISGVKVFDPKSQKFLFTTEQFTTSGNIPNINPSGSVTVGKGKSSFKFDDITVGVGDVIYSGRTTGQYQFLAGAKDVGINYNVVGGTSPTQEVIKGQGVQLTSTISRGRYTGAGTIRKYTGVVADVTEQPVNIDLRNINLQPGTSYSGIIQIEQQVSKIGAAISSETTKQNLIRSIKPENIGRVSGSSIIKTYISSPQITRQTLGLTSIQTSSQILKSNSRISGAIKSTSVSYSALNTRQFNRAVSIVTPITTQQIRYDARTSTRTITSIPPITQTPFIPTPSGQITPGFFIPPMGGGSRMSARRTLTGGKRKTGYTPSYSALIFKIRGAYKQGAFSKSGIDFRPITKGFSIAKSGAIRLGL